jgi:hypothetical protein
VHKVSGFFCFDLTIYRICKFLEEIVTDNRVNVFCNTIRNHLQDKRLSVFCRLPKPNELFEAEQEIIDSFVTKKSIFYDSEYAQTCITVKHIMITALGLLLGRLPSLIQMHITDKNINQTSQIIMKEKSRSPRWIRKLQTIFSHKIRKHGDLYNVINEQVIMGWNENSANAIEQIDEQYFFKIDDVSLGLEQFPVVAINEIDLESLTGKEYVTEHVYSREIDTSVSVACKGCTDCNVHNVAYENGLLKVSILVIWLLI